VSLGRHVALKLLPSHMLPDRRQKQRFELEARAAARLHDTNIVPVFGVGEENGLHYYVMQYIQGQGLDTVLDELRRLQGQERPSRSMTPLDPAPNVHTGVSVQAAAWSLLTRFGPSSSVD
jgi:serine/threonine protein kinase